MTTKSDDYKTQLHHQQLKGTGDGNGKVGRKFSQVQVKLPLLDSLSRAVVLSGAILLKRKLSNPMNLTKSQPLANG